MLRSPNSSLRAPLASPLLVLLLAATAACSGGEPAAIVAADAPVESDGAALDDAPPLETGDETDPAETGEDASPPDAIDDGALADTADDAGDTGAVTPDGGPITSCGPDFDGDGISDLIEGRGAGGGGADVDTDGDAIPDWKDDDSDSDGLPDRVEWFTAGCDTGPYADLNDADGDGLANFRDLDSDGNGLADQDEACPTLPGVTGCGYTKPLDFDGDGVPDFLDFDNDHDSRSADKSKGLPDALEMRDNNGVYKGLAIDTDGDKLPDAYDRDSDNDFILDLDDTTADPDGDGLPAFRDRDADGDGVEDVCEGHARIATAADYSVQTLDSNKNGVPDYLDRDSDGDLLLDGLEDRNSNCGVDASETDRVKADTDGDGVGDLVEITVGASIGLPNLANDGGKTPASQGQFYFLVPYNEAPSPTSENLSMQTTLNKGDIGFVVDTTGSMGGEIANLRTGLGSIISALAANIPDLGIGIAAHDDVPNDVDGTCGLDHSYYDLPNGVIRDVSSAGTPLTAAIAQSQGAANALTTHYGNDTPESQVLGLIHAVDGQAVYDGCNGAIGAVADTATTFGSLRFRKGALPIVVEISDASWHNGVHGLGFANGGLQDINSLRDAINRRGAKFIGVASGTGSGDSDAVIRNPGNGDMSYGDMAYLSDQTGSYVPPSAFGGSCKTGLSGGAVAADGPGGNCRLIFSLYGDGSGLSTTIVSGVRALLNAVKYDVHVAASPAGATDVVDQFLSSVVPTGTGADPETGTACTPIPAGTADKFVGPRATTGTDGTKETMLAVNPGPRYCFAVTPKRNTTIAPTTSPQLFRATLTVWAQNPSAAVPAVTLGKTRDVLFIVPPRLN